MLLKMPDWTRRKLAGLNSRLKEAVSKRHNFKKLKSCPNDENRKDRKLRSIRSQSTIRQVKIKDIEERRRNKPFLNTLGAGRLIDFAASMNDQEHAEN